MRSAQLGPKTRREIAIAPEGLALAQRQAARNKSESQGLHSRVAELERGLQRIQAELSAARDHGTGKRLLREQVIVPTELQETDLISLYAASTRLQETLRRQDVLAAIREIAVNLIGVEDLAVFAVDAQTSTLLLIDGFDSEPAANYHDIPLGKGPIGQAALTGNSYFHVVNEARRDSDANTPMACI
ncbi:MAG: hypothetical protein ACREQV_11440, partial [Candidatus Binatia bacterium]